MASTDSVAKVIVVILGILFKFDFHPRQYAHNIHLCDKVYQGLVTGG